MLALSPGGCGWWQETAGGMIRDYGHTQTYNPETLPVLYCYRTRGQADCYREPQKGQESRLITTEIPRKAKKPPPAEANQTPVDANDSQTETDSQAETPAETGALSDSPMNGTEAPQQTDPTGSTP